MRHFVLTLSLLLLPSLAVAQNGELSFVHGIPGLPATVDVTIDGVTAFSGVDFGQVRQMTVPAGTVAIDVVLNGAVALSANATVTGNGSVTVAAHLQQGGALALSSFANDLSAVAIAGDGRIVARHLADAGPLLWSLESATVLGISGLQANGSEDFIESSSDTYTVKADAISPAITIPLGTTAASSGAQALASDEGLIIHFVGVPGTASFIGISQRVTLAPAVAVNPNACDLSLSGSLVGGSLSAGGDVTFSVTGATPNATVFVLFAFDLNPTTVFNANLGIGGNGFDVIAFGQADPIGNFSATNTYGPSRVSNPGAPSITFNFFLQAVSIDPSRSINNLVTCVSDIETLAISVP